MIGTHSMATMAVTPARPHPSIETARVSFEEVKVMG
jgi:hypothetical protein